MKINIITIFPEIIKQVLEVSIIGKAVEKGKIKINYVNFRDFAEDKHNRVDDYPFGGGPGMLIKPEPVYRALKHIEPAGKVILMSPRGKLLDQKRAVELSCEKTLTIIAGHYEGIDNRIAENFVDEELSIGDYVLTGGELPAAVLIDCVVRLIPGVLGSRESFENDSHFNGLLEYPQYTRPREFEGYSVPDVLLSGNHREIDMWRRYKSLEQTYKINREYILSNKELLEEYNSLKKKYEK